MIDTPAKRTDDPTPEPRAYPARKIWWIVGGTLTAAVLVFTMGVAGVWIWVATSPEESYTLTEQYGPVTDAQAEVEVGNIELESVPGPELELRTHVVWRGSEPDHTEEEYRATFLADAGCDAGLAIWGGIDECRVDYTLGLAPGTPAEVGTDVGDIRLSGVDGEIEAETSVGDIKGVDLRTTGLVAEASVGTVDLSFDQVLGDIEVTTGTGDVVIEVPDDGTTYAVVFDTGVGEQHIDIATDPGAAADRVITVTTGVGSLTVRYAA